MTISIMRVQIPHPIPYQGSKRKLAPTIASFITMEVDTLYEPFAGSAAFTLYAAHENLAKRYVIGDTLVPLIELWRMIVSSPEMVASRYRDLWLRQREDDAEYYNRVREEYNQHDHPVMLLYLIARCVKNAVRFNRDGKFTQSVDNRRKGMNPDKMRDALYGASRLLSGKVEFFAGDFEDCISSAGKKDLIYMDPPYQGTTYGKDKRYYQQLEVGRLIETLSQLNARGIPFLLSYDGQHGEKRYGDALPDFLETRQVLINSGRSSQATLHGRDTITLESLYISRQLSDDTLPDIITPGQFPIRQLPLEL